MLIKIHDISIKDNLQLLSAKDLTKHGRKVIPTKFFVLGFYDTEHLEEHEASSGYDFSKWAEWLEAGHIYIEKPNNSII